jgi:hypothetical protein
MIIPSGRRRRSAGAALAAATLSGTSGVRAQSRDKATFVLVHPAGLVAGVGKRLAPTGRFCHDATYVLETLAKADLIDVTTNPIIPRLECGEPVRGLLVTARAPLRAGIP